MIVLPLAIIRTEWVENNAQGSIQPAVLHSAYEEADDNLFWHHVVLVVLPPPVTREPARFGQRPADHVSSLPNIEKLVVPPSPMVTCVCVRARARTRVYIWR